MRILLLGDYSNVHATLAQALRQAGHRVTLASDGDGWKNYPRDVDLRRRSLGFFYSLCYYAKLWWIFLSFRGYDVVQIINPIFLPLRAERMWPFYLFLRRYNRKLVLAAFGMDHYWVRAACDCQTFRYSDFNLGSNLRHNRDNELWIAQWGDGAKGQLNQRIATDCDGIVAGLYEYYASYEKEKPLRKKLRFIPFPIDVRGAVLRQDFAQNIFPASQALRCFVGVQAQRSAYKGTDLILRVLERICCERPGELEIIKVENLPFAQYKAAMLESHVLFDQIYSYTPAMNALQAMAQGLVVVSGGENENYEILACQDLHPIVNVLPTEKDIYDKVQWLLDHKACIPQLSRDSRTYVERYHDMAKIAQQYLDFWQSL